MYDRLGAFTIILPHLRLAENDRITFAISHHAFLKLCEVILDFCHT